MADTPERRELQFGTFDDVIADAEQLASGEVRTTGNHTFGQILKHLALSNDMTTGKIVGPKPPWFIRLIMPVMKNFILNGPIRPGFKLPPKAEGFFWPAGEVDVQEALTHLKESVEHYKANGPLEVHPMFGKASREQIDRLSIGHCAMHLSFVHPV